VTVIKDTFRVYENDEMDGAVVLTEAPDWKHVGGERVEKKQSTCARNARHFASRQRAVKPRA
jgi:hypothetical protein